MLADPENNMYQLIMSVFHDIDREVLKATLENFFFNANIVGWPKQEENRKKYDCNVPWAILLDPTSACLHINANGDVDPCVFIHYSDSNIREKTLLECLQSPVFKAYHDGQPFHENHLRTMSDAGKSAIAEKNRSWNKRKVHRSAISGKC